MKHLHSRAVWQFFITSFFPWLIIFFFMFGVVTAIADEMGANGGAGIIGSILFTMLITLVPLYIWSRLRYHFYLYELKKDSFYKESGVIIKKYVKIPYSRIQNVDIKRGIVARILGLSDLHIQTAGTAGAVPEGRLPALSINDAEKLSDELIKLAERARGSGV